MARVGGIEIYKLLPRTNCGDCGVPTCMAFAMQVASQKAAIDGCPHVSEDARSALGAAQTPPMLTVTIGAGDGALTLGGEKVMHRHEGRFENPTGIAVRVSAALDDAALAKRIDAIKRLRFDRIGRQVGVDLLVIDEDADSVDAARFRTVVEQAAAQSALGIVLHCRNPKTLAPTAVAVADRRPLLWAATEDNAEEMSAIAAEHDLPLVVQHETFEGLTTLSERVRASGVKQVLLQPVANDVAASIGLLIELRRYALEARVQSLGYPTYVEVPSIDPFAAMCDTIGTVARYAGIVTLDTIDPWAILAIVTARMNLYTDPQVPNAVEAKVYKIGNPRSNAPVLVTTNFALTYFTVAGEVENARIPAHICVMDTEGLGVLNAYADQQLTAESLVDAVRAQGIMDRVDHNTLIIPGLIARLRIAIEELSGWQILIGPEDAGGIPRYLNTVWVERVERG